MFQTLLSILVDLDKAIVWMFLSFSLISSSPVNFPGFWWLFQGKQPQMVFPLPSWCTAFVLLSGKILVFVSLLVFFYFRLIFVILIINSSFLFYNSYTLMHMHTHTHTHTYICMYVYIYISIYACMCVCVCVWSHLFIDDFIVIWMYW